MQICYIYKLAKLHVHVCVHILDCFLDRQSAQSHSPLTEHRDLGNKRINKIIPLELVNEILFDSHTLHN